MCKHQLCCRAGPGLRAESSAPTAKVQAYQERSLSLLGFLLSFVNSLEFILIHLPPPRPSSTHFPLLLPSKPCVFYWSLLLHHLRALPAIMISFQVSYTNIHVHLCICVQMCICVSALKLKSKSIHERKQGFLSFGV